MDTLAICTRYTPSGIEEHVLYTRIMSDWLTAPPSSCEKAKPSKTTMINQSKHKNQLNTFININSSSLRN